MNKYSKICAIAVICAISIMLFAIFSPSSVDSTDIMLAYNNGLIQRTSVSSMFNSVSTSANGDGSSDEVAGIGLDNWIETVKKCFKFLYDNGYGYNSDGAYDRPVDAMRSRNTNCGDFVAWCLQCAGIAPEGGSQPPYGAAAYVASYVQSLGWEYSDNYEDIQTGDVVFMTQGQIPGDFNYFLAHGGEGRGYHICICVDADNSLYCDAGTDRHWKKANGEPISKDARSRFLRTYHFPKGAAGSKGSGDGSVEDYLASGYHGSAKCGEIWTPEGNSNGKKVAVCAGHLIYPEPAPSGDSTVPLEGATCLHGKEEHTEIYYLSEVVGKALLTEGYTVYWVRHTDTDTEYPFTNLMRANAINQWNPDAAIYLHWDGVKYSGKEIGPSRWIVEYPDNPKGGNSVKSKSLELAECIQKTYISNITAGNHGNDPIMTDVAGSGRTLCCFSNANVPTVLLETGNSKNENDCSFIHSDNGRDSIAKALVKAVNMYFKGGK